MERRGWREVFFVPLIGGIVPLRIIHCNGFLCRFQCLHSPGSVPEGSAVFGGKTAQCLRRYIKE